VAADRTNANKRQTVFNMIYLFLSSLQFGL